MVKWHCIGYSMGQHAPGCKGGEKTPCTLQDPKNNGAFYSHACGQRTIKSVRERLKRCAAGPAS